MTQLLIIDGPLPTMNEWAGKKTRWTYRGLKQSAQGIIGAAIRKQRIQPMPFAYLSFTWYAPDRRKNPDNLASACKFILDALVAHKVLRNDGWSEVLGIEHKFVCMGTASAVHVQLTDKH